MRTWPSHAILGVCLLSGAAVAAALPSFVDDGETGTMMTTEVPAGPWNAASFPVPTVSMGPVSVAAHRGRYGIRLTDNDGSSGSGTEGAVEFLSSPATGDYFARAWVRLTASNRVGMFTASQFLRPTAGAPTLVEVQLGAAVVLAGTDDRGATQTDTASGSLDDGAWHLVEWAVTGLGTAGAARSLWLDGVLGAQRTGLPLSSSA